MQGNFGREELRRNGRKQLFDDMPDLNKEQQAIFDDVVESVVNHSPSFKNVFYVDGPAGSGKTFLYRKLIHYLRSKGLIVLIVAVSGIAALLLPGGRTVHSRFRLPVPLPLEGATANITANSGTAQLLRITSLLIWDEAPNAPRAAFDAVSRCLQDVLQDLPNRSKRQPFGGLPVLFGGDFRQIR